MTEFTVPGDAGLEQLVTELAAEMAANGWRLATAESCTGGWIAKCCTDLAGSSAWFERGFVTYSNAAKQDLLGVDAAALDTEGAVSEAVALQMAEGARRRAGVEIAVAVTGIAGPDGGAPEKPVENASPVFSCKGPRRVSGPVFFACCTLMRPGLLLRRRPRWNATAGLA